MHVPLVILAMTLDLEIYCWYAVCLSSDKIGLQGKFVVQEVAVR